MDYDFQTTTLWKNLASLKKSDAHCGLGRDLADRFLKIREKAEVLTARIGEELPFYTEHGVKHLDALWGVADEIIGDDITLNPVEIYVLGVAFLLHDAGMTLAAYPKGMAEIKEKPRYKSLLAKAEAQKREGEDLEAKVLVDFLRLNHADRAGELPRVTWPNPKDQTDVFLIDDQQTRDKLGKIIGDVARSHWNSHDEIEIEFKTEKMPIPGFGKCRIDTLKLACILRCTDAANIDGSRAEGFLWALRRGRMPDDSNDHWLFQERMSQAQCVDGQLVFTSNEPFTRDEASAWWLAYDTLKMIDAELKGCNAILRRNRDVELEPKGVLNIDSPQALSIQIEASDWEPVDTAFTVADLPNLVERLGGAALYGDNPMAPVRELIQNGMDAVRLRRKYNPDFEGHVKITVPEIVRNKKLVKGAKLIFEDDGVGMSATGLVDNLLSFGGSNWLKDQDIDKLESEVLTNEDVSGRFGIGFFSIFMLADQVRVISNRYDQGRGETRVLDFTNGLRSRPMLYEAAEQNRLDGGTRIEATLRGDRLPFLGDDEDEQVDARDQLSPVFPTSDVLLKVKDRGKASEIDGRQWQTEPGEHLLRRLVPDATAESLVELGKSLQPIHDAKGNIVGRASLLSRSISSSYFVGAATFKGAGLSHTDVFSGVVPALPSRASRDAAVLTMDDALLEPWVSAQLDASEDLEEALKYSAKLARFAKALCLVDDAPVYSVNGSVKNEAGSIAYIRAKGEGDLKVAMESTYHSITEFDDDAVRIGILSDLDFGGRIHDKFDLAAPNALEVVFEALSLDPQIEQHWSVERWKRREIGSEYDGRRAKARCMVLHRGMTLEEFLERNPSREDR